MYAGCTRAGAPESESGLPQSLQNRAEASFSWPQKLQTVLGKEGVDDAAEEEEGEGEEGEVGEVTLLPQGKTAWAANIGRAKGRVNERTHHKVVWYLAFARQERPIFGSFR